MYTNKNRQLFRWDIGQHLIVNGADYVDYTIGENVYRVQAEDGKCAIPDELLQIAGEHVCWTCTDTGTRTEYRFDVHDRPMPPDYVYTPTQRETFDMLVDRVNAATTAANTATANANNATTNADAAKTAANAAAANANAKADLASNAAINADSKATLANTAANTANTATASANSAAANAGEKAMAANAAANAANTAAGYANEKATDAGTAAAAANAAATEANTAAANANAKADLANTAAANANAKADLANTAATNANEKASIANTAASNADAKASSANTAAANASDIYNTVKTAYENGDLNGADGSDYVLTSSDKAEIAGKINADTDRRLVNLEAAAQGKLYTGYTDSTAGHVKTVPANALPWASVDMFGGKTVVWNQNNANNHSSTSASGISFSYENGVLHVSGTSTSKGYWCNSNLATKTNWISGHKYYIKAKEKGDLTSTPCYIPNDGGTNVKLDGDGIYTMPNDMSSYYQVAIPTDTTVDFTVRPIAVDLTKMFGSGNEPTSIDDDRIKAIDAYAIEHPEYNSGELISADVDKLIVSGRNLISSYRQYSQTLIVFNNNRYREVVFEPGTYTFSGNSNGVNVSLYYCTANTTSARIGTIANTLTFTINEPFGLWLYYQPGISVDNVSDIILHKGSTALPYTPYHEPIEHTIPSAVRSLTGYGWSAGSVYNEVDFENKKYIQRVGKVDLGTLSWKAGTTSDVAYFDTSVNNAVPDMAYASSGSVLPNIMCAKYATRKAAVSYGFDTGISNYTATINYRIRVFDEAYTSVSDFVSAMSGVMLYYELAEPIETDISNLLTWDGSINVEGGGTIEFHNSNGLDLAVPNKESYLLKVVSEE